MPKTLTYDDALALLRAHNKNESLITHGLSVSVAMEAYARRFGADPLTWRITGLLHDVDYEEHPTIEEHALIGSGWLAEAGYPHEIVHAVLAHNDYHGAPRDDLLSRALFACDELTGLITATALVRPGRTIRGLEASSVRKKMKDKAFARGVNREDIIKGAAELKVDLAGHIQFVIDAMAARAEPLGLAGTESGQ